MALLEVKNLGISFGGLRAVDNFSLKIEKGQLYGLIGPNGAGKTTIFNLLTGVYKPTDGSFMFDGEELAGKSAIDINKKGIARTFQNIRLFGNMSVLDNVKVGLHNSESTNLFDSIFRTPKYRKEEKNITEKQSPNKDADIAPVSCLRHPFKRAALHAWRVSFQHPFKDEFISLEAPLPFDFRELVSFFGPGSI